MNKIKKAVKATDNPATFKKLAILKRLITKMKFRTIEFMIFPFKSY